MAQRNTIPDSLLDEVLQLDAQGMASHKIVEYLEQNHNIKVSADSVQRRIKPWRHLEQEARTNAIKEKAAEAAVDYVDILKRNIQQMDQLSNKLVDEEDYYTAVRYKEVLLKYITATVNTGLTPLTESDEDLAESILTKLQNDKTKPTN